MNYAVVSAINLMFEIFSVLILVDILGSWVLASRMQLPNIVYQILGAVHTIVEPILAPFRRLIPNIGGLDFSPMIALIVLNFARRFIVSALAGGF